MSIGQSDRIAKLVVLMDAVERSGSRGLCFGVRSRRP